MEPNKTRPSLEGTDIEASDGQVLKRCEVLLKKWIDDTIALFQSNVKTNLLIDHLCVTSLTVSSTYCQAIMTLLAREYRMPAKALLRVLFELSVKLLWCSFIPDGETRSHDVVIEEKCKRWAKTTAAQNVKILEEFVELLGPDKIGDLPTRIEYFKGIRDSQGSEGMPKHFVEVIKEPPELWAKEVYPRCYLQFNNAVHLDVSSLGERVSKNGDKYVVVQDSEESIANLAQYCAVFEHIILHIVRQHYGWDRNELYADFHQVTGQGL